MTRPFFHCAHVLGASVLTAAAMASGAHAEVQLPQAGARLQAAVPAQSLAQSLNALSRQAGIAIGADATLLSGKTAPAVRAGVTLQEALDQVLAGSGLMAIGSGPAAISVQARPPARLSEELPVVTVTAQADTETATGPVAG